MAGQLTELSQWFEQREQEDYVRVLDEAWDLCYDTAERLVGKITAVLDDEENEPDPWDALVEVRDELKELLSELSEA